MKEAKTVQEALLLRVFEEALSQPKPSIGLKHTLLMYQGFMAGESIRIKALSAARQRKHRAK